MGGFFGALRRGVAGAREAMGPQAYSLAGKPVICPHCGHNRFAEGRAQLNTAMLTFFKLDWANRSATTLVCAECGRVEWFLQQPTKGS